MRAKECAEHLATKGFDIEAMPERRFPPPWSVDEQEACCIVRANRQALAYVYFEEERGTPGGSPFAHPRRGPAHRRQHHQAVGAGA
jgi:hypothetical protein